MEKTNHSLPLDEQSQKILYELLDGDKKISHFLPIANNSYHTLRNKIKKLKEAGLIKTMEKRRYGDKGPKTIVVSLTERGKVVAEQLRNAEKLAKLTPEEIERFKRMRALIHVNVYEDHITIMDIGWEDERVVNIYARPKGDVVYFWCDVDEDTDCYHIQYMFANPKLSDFVRAWIERNGFKLAKIYQKYVDKYWA